MESELLLLELMEAVEKETGSLFFPLLVQHLAGALGASHVVVGEFSEDHRLYHTLGCWSRNTLLSNYTESIEKTPYALCLGGQVVLHADSLRLSFPDQERLSAWRVDSCCAVPMIDHTGGAIGFLGVLNEGPMPAMGQSVSILRILAARTAAEIKRMRAERSLHVSEERNRLLLGHRVDLEDPPASRINESTRLAVDRHADQKRRCRNEGRLRQSEALGSAVLASLQSHIAVLDGQGTIMAVNEAWKEFGRLNQTSTHPRINIGINYLQVCRRAEASGCQDCGQVRIGVQRVLDGTSIFYEHEYACDSPRERRWFLMTVTPFRGKNGGAVVTHLDITRRKLAETAKHQAERRYEELVDSLEAIVWRGDAATLRTTFVSKQAETLLGYPAQQWLDHPDFWETHLHSDDRIRVLASRRQATQDRLHHVLEYRMLAADGREVWLHDSVHVVIHGSEAKELIGVMLDISERKRADRTLTQMAGQLITVQEEERSRIARELHDDFSQRLALLAIGLGRIGETAGLQHDTCEQIEDMRTLTLEIASDVHRLSHQLHPAKLEHLGLTAAVRGLCRELFERQGIRIDFLHRNVPRVIAREPALCLYRIVQEALNNMVKHSGVREGRLELLGDRGHVHLCISDSGVGFDLRTATLKGRLGLISMQERVKTLGGHILIESRPSRGTRIVVQVSASTQ
ncbi:hypothetical protein W02_01910 [Nitrospira sp. KM1]|nr:hypothetical protein W02_01910 [Nitrospira sp. KM1]